MCVFSEVQESWKEVRTNHSSRSAVLFQEHLGTMIDELQPLLLQHDFHCTVEDKVFDLISEEPALTRKGHKRKNARFMDVLRGLKELLPMWTVKLIQYEYVDIELGMITEKQVIDKRRDEYTKWHKLSTPVGTVSVEVHGLRSSEENDDNASTSASMARVHILHECP